MRTRAGTDPRIGLRTVVSCASTVLSGGHINTNFEILLERKDKVGGGGDVSVPIETLWTVTTFGVSYSISVVSIVTGQIYKEKSPDKFIFLLLIKV